MPDRIGRIRVNRNDVERLPAADLHPALIGRLATTAGIEASAVECDAFVSHGDDGRLSLEAMVVLQVQARSALSRPALVRVHRWRTNFCTRLPVSTSPVYRFPCESIAIACTQ